MNVLREPISVWISEMALSDSQSALSSLYLHYYKAIFRFVNLQINDIEDSEEIVSDIFLEIWARREHLLKVSNFDGYLYAIARNKIADHYRKNRHVFTNVQEQHIDLFANTETTPENDLISKEIVASINAAINNLPNKNKLVFKLLREDRLKYGEVAKILDISIKTVESYITAATKKIREELSKYRD